MDLFIYFVLPFATILLAIVLQKILRNPILVGITFLAIYLIIAFVSFESNLAEAIIATLIYSILAFITAFIVQLICRILRRLEREEKCCSNRSCENDILSIDCNCTNGESSNLLTVSSNCLTNNSNNLNNDCQNIRNNFSLTANVTPCSSNRGRTGSFRGCYRRY